MERQTALALAIDQLPSTLRPSYGGAEIDHANGGEVIVGSTNPDLAEAFEQYFVGAGVISPTIELQSHSEMALIALYNKGDALLKPLRDSGAELSITFSTTRDKVVIYVEEEADLHPIESSIIASANKNPVYDLKRVEPDYLKDELFFCNYSGPYCNPALRGGVEMLTSTGGKCTGGFVARSRWDSKLYMITAGHCLENAGWWYTAFSDFSSHWIGPTYKERFDLNMDGGIVYVNNAQGWGNGSYWVAVSQSPDTNRNDTYNIRSTVNVANGFRICTTGASLNGSDCGTVTNSNHTANFPDGTSVRGLFRVDGICGSRGDSGGPGYAYGGAYGIISSGSRSTCVTNFNPIKEIEDAMNVDVLTAINY